MDTVIARTPDEWRSWLARNSCVETEVWLVIYHKDSSTPSIRYHEAVEQALCFGWIDSVHRKNDAESSRLRFSPRRRRSRWSQLNRQRAATMTEQGLMTERGFAAIEMAKAGGTWVVEPAG
ncbi:YdeI/OmpD-associated family protein [Phytoactinopolyspora limicola]|uniref:YdeI/OmpD-associated family protein n=1 Tax=Phytoactinopolyspora limicola TaxID=2715536 RepID=UPI00140DF23D|nr:hypothetical protein [Phytoactinopolyspora limicola]